MKRGQWHAKTWIATFAVLWLSHAAAQEPLFSAEYRVASGGAFVLGRADYTLTEQSRHRYEYRNTIRTTGLVAWFREETVVERSVWSPLAGALKPHEYSYSRTGGGKEKYETLVFDWDRGVAVGRNGEREWRHTLSPSTIDKLLVTLALMRDLAQNTAPLVYPIADIDKLKAYRFERMGEESVDTPVGSFQAIKLKRIRDPRSKKSTVLWCAPELGVLPVRIDQRQKSGATFQMTLQRVSGWERLKAILAPRVLAVPAPQ